MCGSDDEVEVLEAASRGGRGRKLQEPLGRLATRVKISEMSRCWIDVSCLVGRGLLVLRSGRVADGSCGGEGKGREGKRTSWV